MFDEPSLPARRLSRPVTFRGVGVHTGADVVCVVHPASGAHDADGTDGEGGIVFHRTDTGGTVAADWRHVAATRLQTVIESAETSVATVEHLMSAMSALGIWSARVEIDGPEVPILDGSAAPFLAGLAEASDVAPPGRAIRVLRPVSVRSGNAFAALLPFPTRRFDVGIDFADGDLYQKQQAIANEARNRGLLTNPSAYGPTAVGDTSVMSPSRTGWEQTKGIQRRVLDIPVPDFVDLPVVRDWLTGWGLPKHGRSY